MKLPYVKVTIEAPAYEAKAAAEQYSKDRKYEVLSRSKPYPCKESSNVKIYLHVIKKTQLFAVGGMKERRIVLGEDILMRYFRADMTDDEMKRVIIRLLDDWSEGRR